MTASSKSAFDGGHCNDLDSPPISRPRMWEPRVSNKVVLPPVQLVSACGGQFAVYSRRSPAKETSNQDLAAVISHSADSGVVLVADGLGGMRTGEIASSLAASAVCEAIHQLPTADGREPPVFVGADVSEPPASEGEGHSDAGKNGEAPVPRDLRVAILDGLERANQRILQEASGSATTIAVVEIRDREIRSYHVGDSMVLVCGLKGKMKFQTVSHSPVGFAVEAGIIDADEAMHHEERHLVSNVIGSPEMRIEIGPTMRMARRDTVLLGTDGLFDNLHVGEIVEWVRKGPLEEAVGRLALEATERMVNPAPGMPSKPDDLTIVAYRLGH